MPYKKVAQPMALPKLPRLKFKKASQAKANNPCFLLMSSLLNCWAANGEGAAQCAAFSQDLKTCMETHKPVTPPPNPMNYHAQRLYSKFKKLND